MFNSYFARNFSGRPEGKYNRAGDRYFNVAVNPDDVELLQQYGINVKLYEPKASTPEQELKMQENPDMYTPNIFLQGSCLHTIQYAISSNNL